MSATVQSPTMPLALTLKSYPYIQYQDDPNVAAFFDAYNQQSQANLDRNNALNLPNYLAQSGDLLTWVGTSLYGQPRNALPSGRTTYEGLINTYQLNTLKLNARKEDTSGDAFTLTDPEYQAVIQWNNYKGDGFQFTIRWLKRRVMRFLAGIAEVSGIPTPNFDNTYQVSVGIVGANVTITLTNGPVPLTLGPILQAAVASGLVLLPFQYAFTVVLP